MEKGRTEQAHKSLVYLRAAETHPEGIEEEFAEIRDNIEVNRSIKEVAWFELFTNRDLFGRLWKGALLQFMAQMCGATAIKYYLPTVFLALGLSKDLSLMAGGIESTLKIGLTIMEMFLIDKIGRRNSLIIGAVVMSVAMLVRYLSKENRLEINGATDKWCVASGIPQQHKPRIRLYLHRVHLLFLLRIFLWLWPQCVGLWDGGIITRNCHVLASNIDRSSLIKFEPRA